jgi:class 3 adenylate cyclase
MCTDGITGSVSLADAITVWAKRAMSKREKRTVSLRTLLSVTFGGFVLITVMLAAGLGFWGVRRLTVEFLSETSLEAARFVEQHITGHLEQARRQVEGLGELLVTNQLEINDNNAIGGALVAGLASHPELTALVLYHDETNRIRAWRQGRSLSWEYLDTPLRPDQLERLKQARTTSGVVWGEPFYAPDIKEVIVNVRYSLNRNGEFRGFVSAALSVRQLSSLVAEIGANSGLDAFVLYGENRVLAHPRLIASRDKETSEELPTLAAMQDPLLLALSSGEPIPEFSIAGAKAVRVIVPAGTYFVVLKELRGYGPEPWRFGVATSALNIMPHLNTLRVVGWGGALLPIIGLLVALLAARAIALAIGRVTAAADRIAALELDNIEPVPSSRLRELAAQAKAFNTMAATIRAFATYVPKALVRRLLQAGGTTAVAPLHLDATVMFTDIAGFTTLSEDLEAPEVADLLNHHFTLLATCVEAEHGTVDKYLGDGVLAFWGAPDKVDDLAKRACRAALAIRSVMHADNASRAVAGLAPIRVRIGIHRGLLVVGNIGAPGRINYTIVGDTVNVAQRLQEGAGNIASTDAVTILVSEPVMHDAGPDFNFLKSGSMSVKGRHEVVSTFALMG